MKSDWWKKLLGIKTDREVMVEVSKDPTIQEARKAIKRADRILAELEVIEGKR